MSPWDTEIILNETFLNVIFNLLLYNGLIDSDIMLIFVNRRISSSMWEWMFQ